MTQGSKANKEQGCKRQDSKDAIKRPLESYVSAYLHPELLRLPFWEHRLLQTMGAPNTNWYAATEDEY